MLVLQEVKNYLNLKITDLKEAKNFVKKKLEKIKLANR